jgi:hypothetical protein
MDVLHATEIEDPPQAEDSAVFLASSARSQMGFGGWLAGRVALSEIDLHELERLLASGCPPSTAYRILRP